MSATTFQTIVVALLGGGVFGIFQVGDTLTKLLKEIRGLRVSQIGDLDGKTNSMVHYLEIIAGRLPERERSYLD